MAVETFGSGINSTVTNQLEVRSNTVSKSSKDRSDLLAINSNTAWIKVRSSVNQITDIKQDSSLQYGYFYFERKEGPVGPPIINSNPELAKGSKLQSSSSAGVGRVTDSTAGVDNPMYKNTASRGYRPKPGITSFDVSTKNTYGTLRQAKISFTVWSLEDLEIYDKLYFRPGYSILVEWGHSVYKDNSKNLVSNPSSISDDEWFSNSKIENIEEKIKQLRINTGGNYDGFFGFVYNFSWSFRQDGGYDCTVDVISKGTVLESIKNGKTVDFISTESLSEDENESENTNEDRKSALHFLLNKIEKVKDQQVVFTSEASLLSKYSEFKLLTPFKFFKHTVKTRVPALLFLSRDIIEDLYYIKLGTFLEMFNVFSSLYITTVTGKENLIKFDTSLGEKFITHTNHYSVDPMAAVPPKQPENKDYSIKSIHPAMEEDVLENYDDIMNIMVTTSLLKSELSKTLTGPQEDGVGFYEALRGILSSIQSAFGEINDFDIYVDEETNSSRIIDRKIINRRNKEILPSTINITGLESTVINLNISSKISSDIASQIAIAAQGTSTNYSENTSALLQWNQNTIDRHIPQRFHARVNTTLPSIPDQDSGEVQEFLKNLTKAWNGFNANTKRDVQNTGGYDPEIMENLRQESISRNQVLLDRETVKEKLPPSGAVPVELHVKMLGISGMKVGNTFRVSPGVLPSKYKDYGFIITGLSHSIESGRWYTDIKTQFFSLK